jgi:hypothetical protein
MFKAQSLDKISSNSPSLSIQTRLALKKSHQAIKKTREKGLERNLLSRATSQVARRRTAHAFLPQAVRRSPSGLVPLSWGANIAACERQKTFGAKKIPRDQRVAAGAKSLLII